jgi:cystathionine gamma-synthase
MVHREMVAPDTWAIAAGRGDVDTPGSPLNVPPVLASNFVLDGDRAYTRDDGTATWEAFEDVLGGLERGTAVAFASGMAAAAAIFDLLPTGADIALPDDCYQAVVGLAAAGQEGGRWSFTRLAPDDTGGWLEAAERVDLLWLESPSNPLLHVADLPTILAEPRKAGAIAVVDNTFATPLAQQPLELGADIVLHSATKYLGGHSDLMLGAAVARDDDLAGRLRERRLLAGAIPGALETFLAVRGIRTLHLRVERAAANAHELATRLERHADVSVVRYPGLPTHPAHSTARRFMRGYGAMISFDVHGDSARADAICGRLQIIRHATSLGSVESTIERRAAVPGQQHLPPTLLRLSVGCENVEDLWSDLDNAFGRARPKAGR